jgi:Ca2+-binding RTX toxin-like protein
MATIIGGVPADTISGGSIPDSNPIVVIPQTPTDTVYVDLGAAGHSVYVTLNASDSTIIGGNQSDTLIGLGDGNIIHGGSGSETIQAIGNDNFISGGTGNDNITVSGDNNVVSAGTGDNSITLGNGTGNSAYAGSGNDHLLGGTGADHLYGGSGNSILDGGAGNDTISAGSGNATIIGGGGDDYIIGGPGHDNFFFGNGFGHDTVVGFTSNDVLQIQDGINGLPIHSTAQFLSQATIGGAGNVTTITIGTDTIKIVGLNHTDLINNIDHYVKII